MTKSLVALGSLRATVTRLCQRNRVVRPEEAVMDGAGKRVGGAGARYGDG